jgi:hypothetical protein
MYCGGRQHLFKHRLATGRTIGQQRITHLLQIFKLVPTPLTLILVNWHKQLTSNWPIVNNPAIITNSGIIRYKSGEPEKTSNVEAASAAICL